MLFYLDHFIATFLLPPGCNLLLIIIGYLLLSYHAKYGRIILATGVITLWLFCTPFISQLLLAGLQNQYPALNPNKLANDKSAAIVVLEGGLNTLTPEYGSPTVSESTLSRIRYAAFLHQKTHAPIMVSGNDPSSPLNQTDYMVNALRDYFNTPVKWREDRGYNTAQEGIYAAEILKNAGIKKIYLVTSSLHIPRSVYAFNNKGLTIIPSPTGYWSTDSSLGKLSLLFPTVDALDITVAALHEYIGMLWYKLIYRS